MNPRKDAALDDALADTFPASDPPSQTVPVAATVPRGTGGDRLPIYRVIPRADAAEAFGEQGKYSARRWSSEGVPAVYASLSVGGALLEALAHMEGPVPDDLVLAVATVPRDCIEPVPELPEAWRAYPYRPQVQRLGDEWIKSGKTLALKLPSAICEREFNVLLNPRHRDRARLHGTELTPLKVDPRVRE